MTVIQQLTPKPARNNNNRQQRDTPSYLQALTGTPAPPVSALPRLTPRNSSTPAPASSDVSSQLQSKMRRSINGIFGHEAKKIVQIRTGGRDTFARPGDLRFALQQGGLPTAVSVASTTDPRVVYALAPESGANVMSEAFTRTRNIAAEQGRSIPKLAFHITDNVSECCTSPEEVRGALPGLNQEISRLESDTCRWAPRFFYASRLRVEYTTLIEKLKGLDPQGTEEDLPPRNPTPMTPSRHKRRHDGQQSGVSPDQSRARTDPANNLQPNTAIQAEGNTSAMDTEQNINTPNADLPAQQQPELVFQLPVTSIPFIPNSLKVEVNELWASLLSQFNNARTEGLREECLARIFSIGKLVLRKNGRHEPRNRNRLSNHQRLRYRIRLALEGKWKRLYEDAVEACGTRRPQSANRNTNYLNRCRRTLLTGAVGKAAQHLCSDQPPAASTPENAERLRQLHPSPTNPVSPSQRNELPSAYRFTEAEIRRALRALPFFSAPGPDGLRPSHLKSLANTPGGVEPQRSPVKELMKFVNSAVDGKLLISLRDWVAGGALLGIPNNTKLRPIAIGTPLRRFICRLLMQKISKNQDAISYFHPHQLAVGTRGGCEAIVHAIRHTIEAMEQEGKLMIQIDASNAFNAIERSVILDQCTVHLAPLARWVHHAYGGKPNLLFGEFVILSLTGVQQGDPLSMLLFSLALQPLLKKLNDEFPELDLSAFFADDGTLIGNPETLIAALNLLIREGAKIGYRINVVKTKGWWPKVTPTSLHLPATIPGLPCRISNSDATEVLGAPISTAEGCRRIRQRRTAKISLLWERLAALNDPQISYHILRFCASASKLMYLLRCTPPHITNPICHSFDTGVRKVFEQLHGDLDTRSWKLATMPLREGGLGLTLTSEINGAAYVSSTLSAIVLTSGLLGSLSFPVLQKISAPVQTIIGKYGLSEEFSPPKLLERKARGETMQTLQHSLSEQIVKANLKSLIPSTRNTDPDSVRLRIRVGSCSTPNATRPFATVPNPSTWVQPEIWRTMIGLRLGKKFFTGSQVCPTCAEGQYENPRNLDEDGHHATVCPGRTGTVRRHNGLRDLITLELMKPPVMISCIREWRFPQEENLPHNEQHRLDWYVDNICFSNSPSGFDVTIISPHSSPYNRNSRQTSNEALARAEEAKKKKYEELCRNEGIAFYAVAADIYGSLGSNAEHAVWKMAEAMAARRGTCPKYEDSQLNLKISYHILRSVAIAINRRNQNNPF